MNLWSVGWPRHAYLEDQEWHLIWAWGSDEAIAWFWMLSDRPHNRFLEVEDGDRVDMVVQCHAGVDAEPQHPDPHRERRYAVMRLCGWGDESDDPCVHCGLYPMRVVGQCPDCHVCDECGGCECEEE